MVRVKSKAKKGDDAFQTRKQKTGRKKLSPVTATRAEVHARTLRVTTASAITRAEDALQQQQQQQDETERQHDRRDKSGGRGVRHILSAEQIHKDFREHLAGTRHYKKSVRAAAFSSVTRAIASHQPIQPPNEAEEEREGQTRGADAAFTPLELLHAFTSALDALSDTAEDVRRAALLALRTMLRPPRHPTPDATPQTDIATHAVGVVCDADRLRAALRVLDITLTHAMRSVRRTGVELLECLLHLNPRGFRRVCAATGEWVAMAHRVASLVGADGTGAESGAVLSVLAALLETMLRPQATHGGDAHSRGHTNPPHCHPSVRRHAEAEEWEWEWEWEWEPNASATARGTDRDGLSPDTSARVCGLFEDCAAVWGAVWTELMERRAALFRDPSLLRRAAATARVFAAAAAYLWRTRELRAAAVRRLRRLFVTAVPFTMGELAATQLEPRLDMAAAIADVCVVLAGWEEPNTTPDQTAPQPNERPTRRVGSQHGLGAAWSVVRAFLRTMSPTHPLRALQTLQFATSVLPARCHSALALCVPPLLRHAAVSPPMLQRTAAVLRALLCSRGLPHTPHALGALREALLRVPRLLFALRGGGKGVNDAVEVFLRLLWRAASAGHPVMQLRGAEGTTAEALGVLLPSLFLLRVPGGEGGEKAYVEVSGVLHQCAKETVELAAHLLFYLGGRPPVEEWEGGAVVKLPQPLHMVCV